MMYQRILTIQRKLRNRNANTASPMDCAVCLMFIAAVILGQFVKFYNSVSSSVQYLAECRLVHSLVFSLLSVLAYK